MSPLRKIVQQLPAGRFPAAAGRTPRSAAPPSAAAGPWARRLPPVFPRWRRWTVFRWSRNSHSSTPREVSAPSSTPQKMPGPALHPEESQRSSSPQSRPAGCCVVSPTSVAAPCKLDDTAMAMSTGTGESLQLAGRWPSPTGATISTVATLSTKALMNPASKCQHRHSPPDIRHMGNQLLGQPGWHLALDKKKDRYPSFPPSSAGH